MGRKRRTKLSTCLRKGQDWEWTQEGDSEVNDGRKRDAASDGRFTQSGQLPAGCNGLVREKEVVRIKEGGKDKEGGDVALMEKRRKGVCRLPSTRKRSKKV